MVRLSASGLAALELSQEFGVAVFPLMPQGKTPLTANGCKDAATHPEAVATWWDQWPEANVGIATGAGSHLVVVDVDGAEGEAALRALGEVPRTVTARSGRADGGRHLYFAHPGERIPNSQSRLGPHLDVRGDGGYIVAPPSLHPSGQPYTWDSGLSPWDLDPAPFPAAFQDRLLSEHTIGDERVTSPVSHETVLRQLVRDAATTRDAVDQADRRIQAYLQTVGHRSEGSRNGTAFQIAAWLLRDFGLPGRAAQAYLAEWNAGNQPPLSTRELRAVFASASQHGKRPLGYAHRSDRGHAA